MPRKALLGAALVAATLGCTGTQAHAQVFGARPAIDSAQALDVRTTAAKLRASVRFNEKAGTWWFSYCRVTECANGELETPHQDDNPETDAEAVAARTVEWPVNALAPATEYRVTVHAGNDTHAFDPTTRTFTFQTAAPTIPAAPVAPVATTDAPTAIAPTTTTLSGTAVPGTTGGTGVGSSAFFEWGGANGPLNQTTPAQSMPADANPYPISAGLSGLTPGQRYSYRLVVVRGNQRIAGAVRTWQTTSAPNCLNATTYQTAAFDRIRATGCFRADGNRWVADGPVRLNGVLLEPVGTAHAGNPYRFGSSSLQSFLDGGNRLYIDRPGRALGTTGTWKMSVDNLLGMHQGVLDVDGAQWTGTGPLMSVGADRSVELFDFPLAGQLSLTPHADGTSRLGVLVSLPLPQMDSVTGDAAVKVNPGGDLAFDRLRVEVGALPVRGFELGNLKFLYDRTENQWEGAAEVALPTASRVRVAAAVVVRNGRFGSFEGSVDGLNQHLAYGVFLQRIGVRVGVDPAVRFGGTIGLSAGPKVGGVGILGVQGDFDVSAAGGSRDVRLPTGRTRVAYPGSISITGTGTVFDVPLRTASATWYFSQTPWIEASTSLGINVESGDLTVFRAMGTVAGSLYGRDFELAGGMDVTVFDIPVAKASAVLSTRGVGACGSVAGLGGIGAYKQWGGNYAQIWWCDMEDLRDLVAGTASLHAAGGVKPLQMPAGEDRVLVRFAGQGGAPQVRLHGPGGRTIDTPAAGDGSVMKAGSFVSIRDERSKYTDVLISKPGDGWTYEVLPGSAPIAHVQTAGELPALKVEANVRQIGQQAELHWQLGDLAGRRVTFMEAGPGAPPRVLKRNATASGSVRFTPYLTPERDRQIVALVEQDGKPRSRQVVARYTAPAAPRMTRVAGLRVVRRGGKVTASWQKLTGAAKYRVLVVEGSGRRSLRTVKAPRLALPRTARSATVRAIGFDGQVGKPRTAKVKAAR